MPVYTSAHGGATPSSCVGDTTAGDRSHAWSRCRCAQCVVKTGEDVDNRLLVRVRASKPECGSPLFPKLLAQLLEERTGAAGGLGALAAGDWLGR